MSPYEKIEISAVEIARICQDTPLLTDSKRQQLERALSNIEFVLTVDDMAHIEALAREVA